MEIDLTHDDKILHSLFEKIMEGNTVLFLGAGASITNKKFLGEQIITYYEERIQKDFGTQNLIEFVDILASDPSIDRNDFNNYVGYLLSKLSPSEEHDTLATIPWHTIITTNYDLLIEQAYQSIKGTSNELYELYPIRNEDEFTFLTDKSQLRYIKLNGCLSDKSKYPFVFSTKDFELSKTYYKHVFNSLKNFSDRITFLSIGYSYSDPFGKELLEKFDSYGFRQGRWIRVVDPYLHENRIPYYEDKKIQVLKIDFKSFFQKFKIWENNNYEKVLRSKKLSFANAKNTSVILPPKLLLKLDGTIKQLKPNDQSGWHFIKPKEFYEGEEPNFGIISRNLDVIKKTLLDKCKSEILTLLETPQRNLIPIIFYKGDFGSGKSTFLYRLIHDILTNQDDTIALEVTDYLRLKSTDLKELFLKINTQNILLLFESVEVDSHYKSLLNLRASLSTEQFNTFNVVFLASIRENILEKYKQTKSISESKEVHYESRLNSDEIDELIKKFDEHKVINLRDVKERRQIVNYIKSTYSSDSFLALLELASNGKHINNLISAYDELGEVAKKGFLYTSLLYRFKILMPSSILNNILTNDWEVFREKVINAEGKGLLFQEIVNNKDESSDLLFRTKHPLISEKLIGKLIGKQTDQFKYYRSIITHTTFNYYNSKIIVDMLKAIRDNDTLSNTQLNKLFDLTYQFFHNDPHFVLHYAINLQYRGSLNDLIKANEILVEVSSTLKYRSHRIVHRRAVINFEIAKVLSSSSDTLSSRCEMHLADAEEFFQLKKIDDPFSAYSYAHYLRMKMWELKNIEMDVEEELISKIEIEELFDIGFRIIEDNKSWIIDIKKEYDYEYHNTEKQQKYLDQLNEYYENRDTRPYALILYYNFYQFIREDFESGLKYIEEMEFYDEIFEVAKCLFTHYGRNLYDPIYRQKFFELIRNFNEIEKTDQLRFHYFSYIAEAYNLNFSAAIDHLKEINYKYSFLNPDYNLFWQVDHYTKREFSGTIQKGRRDFLEVYVTEVSRKIPLLRNQAIKLNLKEGQKVKFYIMFYLYGLRAVII